jgi:hypothetical protein
MKRIVALLTSAALLIPGAAVASANSTSSGYGHPSVKNVTASRHNGSGTTPGVSEATTTQTGSLPFTGLDLGALGAGAVVLLGAGIALRRASATDRS